MKSVKIHNFNAVSQSGTGVTKDWIKTACESFVKRLGSQQVGIAEKFTTVRKITLSLLADSHDCSEKLFSNSSVVSLCLTAGCISCSGLLVICQQVEHFHPSEQTNCKPLQSISTPISQHVRMISASPS